jgi:hypothetical protein
MQARWIANGLGSVVVVAALFAAHTTRGDALTDAIVVLKSAQPGEAGQQAAQAAWAIAAHADAGRLPELLTALDDAGPLAANWIRAAIDAIGERTAKQPDAAVRAALEKFTLETTHAPRARRLAFDWLSRLDPTAADRLMPGFADDPSVELRRDAVARIIDQAAANTDQEAAKKLYREAFDHARDVDQIRELTEKLKKLGVEVDLPRHYGFITKWRLIGPFDNVGGKGFNTIYPPETEIKLDAKYPGKDGKEVAWIEHETAEPYGKVDLNKALGKNKGAAAYAYAEFISDAERPVDVRVGSIVAVKYWLNGQLLDSREAYHSGTEIDQYTAGANLQKGVNRILVKVCENEQTESWAQDWEFQLRICDAVGTAVLSQDRVVAK